MDLRGAPQGYQLVLHESHKLAQRCLAWLPLQDVLQWIRYKNQWKLKVIKTPIWKKKGHHKRKNEQNKPFLISFCFQSWAFLISLARPRGFSKGPPGYLLVKELKVSNINNNFWSDRQNKYATFLWLMRNLPRF